jgi:regulator of sigma E protease
MLDLSWLKLILGPIVVFGLVVFVHELGHFLAAKATGVYAPRFSIGFGPSLWKRRWGETEYVLAALPLGGYVRMASRHDEASAALEGGSEQATARSADDSDYDPEAMIPFGPKPIPEHRWFESKSLAARLFILLAGVTMNALLALAIVIGLNLAQGRVTVPTRVVGEVAAVPSAPELQRQIAFGDTIVAVNGAPVSTWNDVRSEILRRGQDTLRIRTHRDSVAIPVGGRGQPTREDIFVAIRLYEPAVVDSVVPGRPASRAGVQAGDTIVAVGGRPVRLRRELQAAIAAAPGEPLELVLRRAGGTDTVTVVPDSQRVRERGRPRLIGLIGVVFGDLAIREPVGIGEAIAEGTRETVALGGLVFEALRGLIARTISAEELGGPIAIVQASASAAQQGLPALLYLLALISINVAIFNLLPIPILDGGQILLNLAEAAKGSAFSARTRDYILRFGLVIIALLFILVMRNDIMRIVRSLG